jgi:glucose/arabinose dehydrogenase
MTPSRLLAMTGLLTTLLLLTACAGATGQPAAPATAPAATAALASPPAPAVASPTPTAAPPTRPATLAPATTRPPAAVPTAPAAATPAATGAAAPRLATERVAGGLDAPVDVRHAGDGSGRLFVVEKIGRIRIVKNGAPLPTPFLDIAGQVNARSSERGLLGLAFHPRYPSNGLFFVNYTDLNGDTVVARYQVTKENPDRADPSSAKTILAFKQPYPNHNGGNLVFGPDGYLWIGTGDGGSAGDPQGNGQNGQALLGKMLRIDVDRGDPYAIPPDNPYVNDPRFRPEVWAIGLRNPWRYSFDRATGDLFIADVGQGRWEEIDVTPAGTRGGVNYGWNIMEGSHCFRPAADCDRTGLALPVAEYGHDKGCSVTGGHVYRGTRIAGLAGVYLFGDFCSGRLWTLTPRPGGGWTMREALTTTFQISSFGEEPDGEILIVSYATGEIYRLVAATV